MNITENIFVVVYSEQDGVIDSFYYDKTPSFKRGEYYRHQTSVLYKIESVIALNSIDHNKRLNTRTYQITVNAVAPYQLSDKIAAALEYGR